MKEYRNFELVLSNYSCLKGRESMSVRVNESPVGKQGDDERVTVEFPWENKNKRQEQQGRLKDRELHEEELIAFGENLAKLLFPPAVRDIYFRSRAKLQRHQRLRIQISTQEPKLDELPWEYAYVWNPGVSAGFKRHGGFLALDREISIVRFNYVPDLEPPDDRKVLRIVALFSDGRESGLGRLDTEKEEDNLRQALAGVDGVELSTIRYGRLEELQNQLIREGAQVFHFAGHGTIEEEPLAQAFTYRDERNLIVAGARGGKRLWDEEKVAMQLGKRGIHLAVLSACDSGGMDPNNKWSGVVRALVQQKMPAVVGMQFTVRDDNAVAFSHGFYQALASGKSIDTAVSEGRHCIFQRPVEAGRDWGVPVLYLQTDKLLLFPKPQLPLHINLVLFTATAIVMSYWFLVHILPSLSDLILKLRDWLGISAFAVAGFWFLIRQLGLETLKTLPRWERDSWLESKLRHPVARPVLIFSFILALVLFITTNSVHLILPEGENHPEMARIDLATPKLIRDTNENMVGPIWDSWHKFPNLSVDEKRRLAGGWFFSLPWADELSLALKIPEGAWEVQETRFTEVTQAKTIKPRPWRSINLSVSEIDYLMIRLVPKKALNRRQTVNSINPKKKISLNIKINDKEAVPMDAYRGAIYLGTVNEAVMKHEVALKMKISANWNEDFLECWDKDDFEKAKDKWSDQFLQIPKLAQVGLGQSGSNQEIKIEAVAVGESWSENRPTYQPLIIPVSSLKSKEINSFCIGSRPGES
jgi:hypothetical protein